MIIDTHIHLDSERYNEDLQDVIDRSTKEDVKGFIIPGADPADLEKALGIAKRFPNTFIASGIHPYHAREYDEKLIREYAKSEKCVAIGECGLDYYRLPEGEEGKSEEKRIQKDVFQKQIEIAKEFGLPLIVHIRDANQDSYDILKTTNAKEVGGVLHCYNASELLLDLAEDNFYYGIGGVLTFKNAKELPHVLKKIPLEKIVIETDGPYLTPHPHRGKRNEPGYTNFVSQKIAEILELSKEEVDEITTKNALECFKRVKIA